MMSGFREVLSGEEEVVLLEQVPTRTPVRSAVQFSRPFFVLLPAPPFPGGGGGEA